MENQRKSCEKRSRGHRKIQPRKPFFVHPLLKLSEKPRFRLHTRHHKSFASFRRRNRLIFNRKRIELRKNKLMNFPRYLSSDSHQIRIFDFAVAYVCLYGNAKVYEKNLSALKLLKWTVTRSYFSTFST